MRKLWNAISLRILVLRVWLIDRYKAAMFSAGMYFLKHANVVPQIEEVEDHNFRYRYGDLEERY